MKSEQINELAEALAKAQGEMVGAREDSVNPHLRNKYASLASYIEAARMPLSANGLAFSQIISQGSEGVMLETMLIHSSGQWLQSEVLVDGSSLSNKGVNDIQTLGSALTYFRRYALAAILGISTESEDDDGQSGGSRPKQQQHQKPAGNGSTNGKEKAYKFQNTAQKQFYKDVQTRTNNGYDNPWHLLKVIGGSWFDFSDGELREEKLSLAIDHVRIGEPEQEPLFDEPTSNYETEEA